MPISIRNPEVKRPAQLLAEQEGTNVIESIKTALESVLRQADRATEKREARIVAIAASFAALPDLDRRPESEILGYGTDGAF